MSTKLIVIATIITAMLLTGCGAPAAGVETQPVQAGATGLLPTDTPAPTQTATATIDAAATQSAQQTADASATQVARATEFSARSTATMAARVAAKQAATAAVEATADARQSAYTARIKELSDAGVITSAEGEYLYLGDYEASEARINTPFVEMLGFEAVNFIISADMRWESASDNANWPTSGCGFVYGYEDNYNGDLTFLGLDGYTHSIQFRDDRAPGIFAFKKWGDPERPTGKALAQLVVFDKRVSVYVNGALANEFYNGLYNGGQLGLNIFSGTNKGYGTRCNFKDVELFLFKQ